MLYLLRNAPGPDVPLAAEGSANRGTIRPCLICGTPEAISPMNISIATPRSRRKQRHAKCSAFHSKIEAARRKA
jgi:hypothetical protein